MFPNSVSPPWSVRAACRSEAGQVRQQSEDQCLVDLKHLLFLVSDGLGGHQAGEIAAQAVITVLPAIGTLLTREISLLGRKLAKCSLV